MTIKLLTGWLLIAAGCLGLATTTVLALPFIIPVVALVVSLGALGVGSSLIK